MASLWQIIAVWLLQQQFSRREDGQRWLLGKVLRELYSFCRHRGGGERKNETVVMWKGNLLRGSSQF